jgi:hypothetical protein
MADGVMLAHAGGVPEAALTLVAVLVGGVLLFTTELRRRREARRLPDDDLDEGA